MADETGRISERATFNEDTEAFLAAYATHVKREGVPLPSQGQASWLDLELGMFVHFGVNTYHDLEWSDGTLDPATFNPVDLDCDQWIRVARDLDARYVVLTAKHHDGFCLWPTKTTDYSVKRSPWKGGNGDVVREFTAACKRAGMGCGLYLSPWDRHEPCYQDKAAYDAFYDRQLTELLTWYDTKFVELWFDGAGSVGRAYDWDRIMATCKHYQPQAMIFNMGEPTIRWAGNENGTAPYPLWNVVPIADYPGPRAGKPAFTWFPAECDMPVRYHTWFYNTGNEAMISPPEELFKCHAWSVGRGANLLLNFAPGRDGLVPAADASAAKAFGDVLRKVYASPVAETSGNGKEIILDLGSPRVVNCIVLQEDIKAGGQRVVAYEIDRAGPDGQWTVLARGSTIGHKKIDLVDPVETTRLRVRVTRSVAGAVVKRVAAYHAAEFDEFKEYMEGSSI